MARTIGYLVAEARQMLNDEVPISGASRYSDAELVSAINDGVQQVRAKRPDAFLRFGLRNTIPLYAMPGDTDTELPFDDMFYAAMLYYTVGRSELTEDTFTDDGRAVALTGKFVAQLLRVQS
jgi:hypothetical protein